MGFKFERWDAETLITCLSRSTLETSQWLKNPTNRLESGGAMPSGEFDSIVKILGKQVPEET